MQEETEPTKPELRSLLCPLCGYDQLGVQSNQCPECGVIVDPGIVWDQQFRDCLRSMKKLCYAGAIGWAILGVAFWFISMLPIALARTYGFATPTAEQEIGAWMRPMIVIAPIALLLGWSKTMKSRVYHRALHHEDKRSFVPIRVQLVALPAILFGSLILILLFGAILT